MIYTLDTPLSEAINAADRVGACEDDIDLLHNLYSPEATIGDLANHPNAAYWAYWFARYVIGSRFEEVEPIIATNAIWSYSYARYVINGQFEEGEAAIATNTGCTYLYTKNVIKKRFEIGEKAIVKDFDYSRLYSTLPGVPENWKTTISTT